LEMKMEGSEKSWILYFTCQLRYVPSIELITAANNKSRRCK
jgi:hypothetical protein